LPAPTTVTFLFAISFPPVFDSSPEAMIGEFLRACRAEPG
jgi:hypothetical protein